LPQLTLGHGSLGGQVNVKTALTVALDQALAAQVNQHRMTASMQRLSQLLGAQTGRTGTDQGHQRARQIAGFGKADILVKPQPVATKARYPGQGVPAGVVGKAAVIANLSQQTAHRYDRAAHLVA
jgi:hypothetical protein